MRLRPTDKVWFMRRILPILFFTVLTLFFLWETILRGLVPIPADILVGHYFPWKDYIWEGREAGFPIKNFQLYDVVRQLYPWREFSISMLQQGEIPFWNPYNFTGTPHLANLPTATFYPFNLLFLVFPFLATWVVYLGIQPVLAGTFMYLYLRNLNLTKLSCLFGGIAFAFSSFMMMRFEFGIAGHTFLWVPLVLLAIDKFAESNKLQWWLLGIVATLLMFLGGYLQAIIYGYGLIFVYAIYRLVGRGAIGKTYYWLGFLVFPILLAAFQCLPFLETILQSSRIEGYRVSELEAVRYLLPWRRLISILAPDFFGSPATGNFWGRVSYTEFAFYNGIVPLVFAFYTLVHVGKKDVKFWFIVLFFAFAFLVDTPVAKLPYALKIPGWSVLLPSRLVSVINLVIPILAAFGWSHFQHACKKDRRTQVLKVGLAVLLIGIILFILWGFTLLAPQILPQAEFLDKMPIAKRNLVLPTIYLLFLLLTCLSLFQTRWKISIFIPLLFLVGLTSFDLIRQARKYNSFVPASIVNSKTESFDYLAKKPIPPRVMITHPELLPVESNISHRFAVIDGYDSVHSRRIEELLPVLNDETVESRNKKQGRVTFTANVGSLALNLLSPEYVYTLDKDLNNDRFELVMEEGRTKLYRNLLAYPRVYLTKDIDVYREEKQILTSVIQFAKKGDQRAILAEEVSLSAENLNPDSWSKVVEYTPNRVTVKTSANTDAMLVLNDAYDRNWRAIVNSKDVPVLRVNYAFRGVQTPAGEHVVKFIYDPKSFKIGRWVSVVSAIFLVSILIHDQIVRKRSKTTRKGTP